MKVQFGEIPEEGKWLDITDESWFPDQEVIRQGQVSARVYLERKNDRVLLEGMLNTIITIDCDRCLDSFNYSLDFNFKIDLELAEGDLAGKIPNEHACGSEEMDVMFLDEPAVDLFYILQQQVFLALPAKKLCKTDCLGLCPKCGENLNQEHCKCHDASDSSLFSILGTLKH